MKLFKGINFKSLFKKIYGFLPYFLIILYFLYFIADIVTSNQTYHDNADRTISKVLLIILIAYLFVSVVTIFIIEKRYKQTPIQIYIFISFFALVALLPVFRDSLAKRINSNTLTLSIYPIVFCLLCLFWMMFPIEQCNKAILILFYYLLMFACIFFMLFYFFKVQSTPLASLNFRKAIYSHIYILVGLFPISILLFGKNELLLNFAIIFISIIISDKGVPLVAFIILLFLGVLSKILKRKKLLLIITVSLIALFIAVIAVDFLVLKNAIMNKIVDQSTLIRINGYLQIFDDLKNFSPFEIVFGKGVSAVIEYRGLAAHNDFLEYLYDYGIFGFSVFVAFLITAYICLRKLPNKSANIILMNDVVITIVLPIVFFSAIFTNTNIILFSSFGILMHKYYSPDFSKDNIEETKYEYYEILI